MTHTRKNKSMNKKVERTIKRGKRTIRASWGGVLPPSPGKSIESRLLRDSFRTAAQTCLMVSMAEGKMI